MSDNCIVSSQPLLQSNNSIPPIDLTTGEYPKMSTPNNNQGAASVASALTEDEQEVDMPPLSSIWDDDKIEKINDRGNKEWVCGWCSLTFKHWNPTKALYHVAKVLSSVHVAKCRAYIPEKRLQRYRALVKEKQDKKAAQKRIAEANAEAIEDQQADVTASRLASKVARRSSGSTSAPSEVVIDMTVGQPSVLSSGQKSVKSSGQMALHSYRPHESQGGKNQRQSTVLEENEAACDTAIAQCIHGLNFSLSVGEKSLFQRMIVAARLTGDGSQLQVS